MPTFRNPTLAQDFLGRMCAHPDWIYDLDDGILDTLPEDCGSFASPPRLQIRGQGPAAFPVAGKPRHPGPGSEPVPLFTRDKRRRHAHLDRIQAEGWLQDYIRMLGKRLSEEIATCAPLMDELAAEGRLEAYLADARSRMWEQPLPELPPEGGDATR